MRQAFAYALGTPLSQLGRISAVGLILRNTHGQGLQYGPDFDNLQDIPLDDLPRVATDEADTDYIFDEFEMEMAPFDGTWEVNSRICLQAASPRPCSVLACSVTMAKSG